MKLLLLIPTLYLVSCSNVKTKRILIDDVIVEGLISNDTVYNGPIKFYDPTTNKLLEKVNYKDGILEGSRIEYYDNGQKRIQTNYRGGKLCGEIKFFDSLGTIENIQFRYYDLVVGPSIHYHGKEVEEYYFYSFDRKQLVQISYDSIAYKSIAKLNDTQYFFWDRNDVIDAAGNNALSELFLYLPNPPGLNFDYSVCVINDSLIPKKVLKDFGSAMHWDTVMLNKSILKEGEYFAIKLTANSEFDNNDSTIVLIKKL